MVILEMLLLSVLLVLLPEYVLEDVAKLSTDAERV